MRKMTSIESPKILPSEQVKRFADLFNNRDWNSLRQLLADDVRLNQSMLPTRRGSADVGMFFSIYESYPTVVLRPALLEGKDVLAVYEPAEAQAPSYFMWLEWRDSQISYVRDYRYVRYVVDDAEFEFVNSL